MGDFTYKPGTDRGYVRLLLGDTNVEEPEKQIFTDAEIDQFLSREGEVLLAAARAAEAIATSAARSAVAWKALGKSVDKKSIPKHYREAAKSWKKEARSTTPSEEIDRMDHDYGKFGQRIVEFVGEDRFY